MFDVFVFEIARENAVQSLANTLVEETGKLRTWRSSADKHSFRRLVCSIRTPQILRSVERWFLHVPIDRPRIRSQGYTLNSGSWWLFTRYLSQTAGKDYIPTPTTCPLNETQSSGPASIVIGPLAAFTDCVI